MIDARKRAELGEALAQLSEVDCGLLLFESRDRALDLQLDQLRNQLEQMRQALDQGHEQPQAEAHRAGADRYTKVGRDAKACQYRELLGEFEDKREVARSSRMLMARERRVLEIRRRRLLAIIPPEIIAAYARLQKRVPA